MDHAKKSAGPAGTGTGAYHDDWHPEHTDDEALALVDFNDWRDCGFISIGELAARFVERLRRDAGGCA